MIRSLIFTALIFIFLSFRQENDRAGKLAEQAILQTKQKVVYDPAYVKLKYPNGDVPSGTGVCTDLVIRAFRGIGTDLQKEVHEDMKSNFKEYPNLWKLKGPDANIDHRRVPNLMIYFKRKGMSLRITKDAGDFLPGDLVTWNLQNRNSMAGITHIGIVTSQKATSGRYLIAHNIGRGNELEDMIFSFTVIGHYRLSKP